MKSCRPSPRSVGSSCCQLTNMVGTRMTCPLRSTDITPLHQYYRAVHAHELRIRTLTLVVLPLVASPFSIEVQVPTFRLTASWQAQATSHAGCRSARKQVSSELIPQQQ